MVAPNLGLVWREFPASGVPGRVGARASLPRTGAGEAMEQEYALTRDPATGRVPVELLLEVRQQRDALIRNGRQHLLAPVEDLVWEERGPNNVGGRSRVAWFDLGDAANGYKKVWAAGVGGGLWYTNDITATSPGWVKVNDFFDNLAISAFAQHPANPQVMYFGTGEGWFNADAIEGLGIWKSTDGGSSWQRLTSTANFAYVQDLLLDASGNLYASLRNRLAGQAAGIQKSTDGGNSWTQVLGAPVQGSSNRGGDLEIAPNGDLYASIGLFSTGRIYRSSATQANSTGNAGTWADITPDPSTNQVPITSSQDSYNRIEIAVPASTSSVVYALFEDNTSRNVSHIKQYNPGTNSWTDKPVPRIIDQKSNVADRPVFTRGQAWYDLIALVDP
ncbi:MAG: hypothetical protein MUF29_04495, partial [Chitinophagaceae bacterium]|nr:hypothetical protein [Chitinophagaceae bacterium]